MNIIILSLIVLIVLIIISNNKVEQFDFIGKYPWYRDPYSIYLWTDIYDRQRWYNLFHRRPFMTYNHKMYIPDYLYH